jgi:hypothetical protein
MKLNRQLLIIILLLSIYHYYIHNNIEKKFSQLYLHHDIHKRPLFNCTIDNNIKKFNCIGMPSGHAEFTTLFCSLLYFNKIIPLWICLLFIIIVSLQRVLLHRHTGVQVLVGIILGFFYASLYNYFNLSIIGFIIVLLIGFILSLFIINKMNS